MNKLDIIILGLAKGIQEANGDVTTRDIYAALPDAPSLHRSSKRDPSLAHISRVLTSNGYRPVGKTRGGYTHYRKEE